MLSAIPPINMLVNVDTSSFSALNHNLSRGTATQFIMYLCHYIEIFVCYDACHLQNVLLDYIQPCRRQCTQSNNDINNYSCMLKWDKSRLWILMHSPVIYGTTDHTVSRCPYVQRKVHNIHKWHSQIMCISIKNQEFIPWWERTSNQHTILSWITCTFKKPPYICLWFAWGS